MSILHDAAASASYPPPDLHDLVKAMNDEERTTELATFDIDFKLFWKSDNHLPLSQRLDKYSQQQFLTILIEKFPPLASMEGIILEAGVEQINELQPGDISPLASDNDDYFLKFVAVIGDFTVKFSKELDEMISHLEEEEVLSNEILASRDVLTILVDSFPYLSVAPAAHLELQRLFLVQIRHHFGTNILESRGGLIFHLVEIFTGCHCHHAYNNSDKMFDKGMTLLKNNLSIGMTFVACGSFVDMFVEKGFLELNKSAVDGVEWIKVPEGMLGEDSSLILPPVPAVPAVQKRKKVAFAALNQGDNQLGPIFALSQSDHTQIQPGQNLGPRRSERILISQQKKPPTQSVEVAHHSSDEDDSVSKSDSVSIYDPGDDTLDPDEPMVQNDGDDNIEAAGIPDNGEWSEQNYTDDGLWTEKGFSASLREYRPKRTWTTPAACMAGQQRKKLKANVETMTNVFDRYSQRPGMEFPSQEFILLQITDINGVGHKYEPLCRRKKTAAMAYGRPKALDEFKRYLESETNGENNYVNHTATDIDELTHFWRTNEAGKTVNEDADDPDDLEDAEDLVDLNATTNAPTANSEETVIELQHPTGLDVAGVESDGQLNLNDKTNEPPAHGEKTGQANAEDAANDAGLNVAQGRNNTSAETGISNSGNLTAATNGSTVDDAETATSGQQHSTGLKVGEGDNNTSAESSAVVVTTGTRKSNSDEIKEILQLFNLNATTNGSTVDDAETATSEQQHSTGSNVARGGNNQHLTVKALLSARNSARTTGSVNGSASGNSSDNRIGADNNNNNEKKKKKKKKKKKEEKEKKEKKNRKENQSTPMLT